MRLSGPLMNKLPVTVREVMMLNDSRAAAQLWR
jgi:hypothetical protein